MLKDKQYEKFLVFFNKAVQLLSWWVVSYLEKMYLTDIAGSDLVCVAECVTRVISQDTHSVHV